MVMKLKLMPIVPRMVSLGLALCLLATACRKGTKDDTEVTFVNRISRDVTVDIYGSQEDYKNNSNRILRRTLSASGKIGEPGTTFTAGKTYYMDWYTDDYAYNNWYNDLYNTQGKSYVQISPKVGGNTYYTEDAYMSNARKVFIDNTQSSTSWHAVNYYAYSGTTGYESKWNTLSENEQYRRITIYKDFTAKYEYRDEQGGLHSMNINFAVQPSKNGYIEFHDEKGVVLGQMESGRLPTGNAPEYTSVATDTVMALLPGGLENQFMMVKE